MKEDLVGMLTHDMGNPVLSMKSALQLLLGKALGPLNLAQREVMELALSTNRQLHDMVANFLDIYRSENGQFLLRKQQLDMGQMLQDSINQLQLFAREKQLSIHFDSAVSSCFLNGDRNRLKRTCLNLLANAIKYSIDGGQISVELDIVSANDDILEDIFAPLSFQHTTAESRYLLTRVTDQGFGIPKQHQLAVFEKFFSLASTDEESRRGLGLGLNFCKLVVEAHGGAICTRTPVKTDQHTKTPGCQFLFALPLEP
jgi:signal transduction histidine kinase